MTEDSDRLILDSSLELDSRAQKWASSLQASGYAPMAEFLLESHLPAMGVVHAALLCSQPFIAPFVGSDRFDFVKQLLEDSVLRDQFLNLLSAD